MDTTRYSTELDHPLDAVWLLIRDFNNYPAYIDGVTESMIEDDRPGDEVGATRRFCYDGNWIRQRLGAHSDAQHMLTYVGIDPFVFPPGVVGDTPPPAGYQGTIRLRALEPARTVLDWEVSVETAPAHRESWHVLLSSLIATWAGSLEATLDRATPSPAISEQ